MNRIEVNGIKLYAYHGCLKEEGVIGGHYVVDVTIDADFSVAAETDDLSNTVDYVDVNRIVTEEMAIRSKLIECVGWRIVEKIKALDNVTNVTVKVTKLSPPINGDVNNVAIIIQE